MTESIDTQTTRASRGRTHMDKLAVRRVQGTRKAVSFNKLGQPIGQAAAEMQSYIGLNHYTTTIPDSDNTKFFFQFSYNVDPSWRKSCLTSANNKWRHYKEIFTSKYILSKLDNPDELNEPPSGYGIAREDWSSFVIVRMSDDFILGTRGLGINSTCITKGESNREAREELGDRDCRRGLSRGPQPDVLKHFRERRRTWVLLCGRRVHDLTHVSTEPLDKHNATHLLIQVPPAVPPSAVAPAPF
ncbi:hypothetical protein F511_22768 [Dorcoceras hygrometricum]|uniref:Uncharacterized protein n=1 Tax=Dorcoceras hygrometricum TaxID=472368 RepID=A0A2Z7D8Z3_9LAMI|nr:hypothetical protein F511_22768 [Dorcoceras hygrometricum]